MDLSSFNYSETFNSTLTKNWDDIIQLKEGIGDIKLLKIRMNILREHTYRNCLPLDLIDALTHILFSNLNNKTNVDEEVKSLIDNLVPEEELKESQIDDLLIWLITTGTCSKEGAVHLIHWLLLAVENNIINIEYIQKNFYFSLLNLLEDKCLVKPLSVFLKKVTHRNHCRTFIVNRVLTLMNENTNSKSYLSALVGEMLKYNQNFGGLKLCQSPKKILMSPDSLKSNFSIVKSHLFPHQSMDTDVIPDEKEHISGAEIVKGLPKIMYNTHSGKRLFDLQNLEDMVNNWGRISSPNLSLSSLSNDIGLTFVKYAPPDWQERFIVEVKIVLNLIKNNQTKEDINPGVFLERLASLQITLQESIPCVSTFFSDYMMVWDSVRYRETLLKFIPWLYFDSIEEMKLTMQRLQQVFVSADLSFKLSVIKGFGKLYSNMVIVHLKNYKLNDCNTIFGSQSWLRDDPLMFLMHFTKYVEEYLISAFVTHSFSSAISLEAILFYHTVAEIQMVENDVNSFTIIPSIMVISSILSSNYAVIEKLCSLMNLYDQVFVPRLEDDKSNNYSEVLQSLELYKKEIITFLWNEKEFENFENTEIGKIVGSEMISDLKSSSLNLAEPGKVYNHPAFATFFIELRNSLGISQSLTKNACIDILKHIAPQCSFFIENFPTNLKHESSRNQKRNF